MTVEPVEPNEFDLAMWDSLFTNVKTSIYILAAFFCLTRMQIHAQTPAGTNAPAKTYPIKSVLDGWGLADAQYYYHEKIMGNTIPEMLPAAQDPAGNWGKPTDNWQLSLRFRHNEFQQTGTVTAVIILRNLDSVSRRAGILVENEFQYTLKSGTNTWLYPPGGMHERFNYNSTPLPTDIDAGAEILQLVWLNRVFNVGQPGKYSLQVQYPAPISDEKGQTNVISGTATFEIVEKPSH